MQIGQSLLSLRTPCRLVLPVAVFTALLSCARGSAGPVSPDLLEREASTCWERLAVAQNEPSGIGALLRSETAAMQLLLEEGLALRARTVRLAREVLAISAEDGPLPGAEIDALHRNLREGLSQGRRFRVAAVAHSCWAEADGSTARSRGLEPLDVEQRLEGAMLELAATLFLYDTYILAVSVLGEDTRVRRVLNERDPAYGTERGQLAAIDAEYLSITQRTRVRELIRFREANPALLEQRRSRGRAAGYIEQLVAESPSYSALRDASLEEAIDARFHGFRDRRHDDLSRLAQSAEGGMSRTFGNTLGLVQTRHGKLHDRPEVEAKVAVRLRAGDILLEKTPFRLTDKLIPGHWGHVAIWVGTEAELRASGIWSHPLVQRYRQEIRDDRLVVEALRDGVQLNTLGHFLDIDDLAVLRTNVLGSEELASTIVRALEQVGKDYDFNFDVESSEKIVCSELIYAAYTDVVWPTDRQLGRYTISPDNVATLALGSGPFDLILLYHDGQRVQERSTEQMASWMDAVF